MSGPQANLPEDERPSVLVHYPSLAEALEDLIDEYGLDLVQDGLEEWIEENECD